MRKRGYSKSKGEMEEQVQQKQRYMEGEKDVYTGKSRVESNDDLLSSSFSGLEQLVSVKQLLPCPSNLPLLVLPLRSVEDVTPSVIRLEEERKTEDASRSATAVPPNSTENAATKKKECRLTSLTSSFFSSGETAVSPIAVSMSPTVRV